MLDLWLSHASIQAGPFISCLVGSIDVDDAGIIESNQDHFEKSWKQLELMELSSFNRCYPSSDLPTPCQSRYNDNGR